MTAPGILAFDHLERLSDDRGLFEHAAGTLPRAEHGYCTDDNARLLVVTAREDDTGSIGRLGRLALGFVLDAQSIDGRFHNRMDRSGRWTDLSTANDCWGRALWGLGATATHHDDPVIRRKALRGFNDGSRHRSRWPRTMAFATLGAVDVLTVHPGHRAAHTLIRDALDVIGTIPAGDWPWPEQRLTYANAALAEAVIAAGDALGSSSVLDRGLTMLAWLLELETQRGHLSVTGTAGCGPDDRRPQFDQQPIEAAAMADACWRAYTITGEHAWSRGVSVAAGWFTGDNDIGLSMHDDESGGGYDGLQPDGVNINQGAESTLALISTMQRARSFAPAA